MQTLVLISMCLFQIACSGSGSGTIIISDSTEESLNGEYQLENIEARDNGAGTFIDCNDGCITQLNKISVTIEDGGFISVYLKENGSSALPYTCLDSECENVNVDIIQRTISFDETTLNQSTTDNELKISGTISYPKPQSED